MSEYKTVPVEPTDEMLEVAERELVLEDWDFIRVAYKAMLAAAPQDDRDQRIAELEAKLKEGAVSDLMNEFNGLANMVNELWGDKAPSMREVIVRAKAMLEASGFNKTHKEGAL